MVDEGQTVEGPVIVHGGGGLIVADREQVLLVVNGPLVTVSVTLTV